MVNARHVEFALVAQYDSAMHVFTYGSLMFPEVWSAAVGRDFETVDGGIVGYCRFRVRDAVFPGLVTAQRANTVKGVVYLDVDDESIERLDRFEDDFYERCVVRVGCLDAKERKAEAYLVPERHRHVLTDEEWTPEWFVSSGGLAEFIARFQGFSRLGGAG